MSNLLGKAVFFTGAALCIPVTGGSFARLFARQKVYCLSLSIGGSRAGRTLGYRTGVLYNTVSRLTKRPQP